jgi:hypothetical protein
LKGCGDFHAKGRKPMTWGERLKAIAEMDAVIERAEHACQAYELTQMEMMAALGAREGPA